MYNFFPQNFSFFLVSPVPPTRAAKSVGRSNLLKQIRATLESSQDVIDEGPEKSKPSDANGPSEQSAEPSGRVTTVAELLRSQNQQSPSSGESDDDFFLPTATQMALGATQTPAHQGTTDESFYIGATKDQPSGVMDSQTANPPNAPYENRIAEFDQTIDDLIDDAMEVRDSSDDNDSENEYPANPEFPFLDSQNADSNATKEVESTEIPDFVRPKDISNTENSRWVFKKI